MVWSNIAVPFFYHPIYMIIGTVSSVELKTNVDVEGVHGEESQHSGSEDAWSGV